MVQPAGPRRETSRPAEQQASLEETRSAYDVVAPAYAAFVADALDSLDLDRAVLGVFAQRVHTSGGGRVMDLGCGPGHVTRHLRSLGLDASGLDLSPRMVDIARDSCPGASFDVGSLTGPVAPAASLGGVLAWYSIIHLAPDALPAAFSAWASTLRPGAPFLLAFQAGGGERVVRDQAYGHEVRLTNHRHDPQAVEQVLREAHLQVTTRVVSDPEGPYQRSQQAYLLGHRTEPDDRTA